MQRLAHVGQPLDTESHTGCPGHAAYLRTRFYDDSLDVVHVCTDPAGHGHTDRYPNNKPESGAPGGR